MIEIKSQKFNEYQFCNKQSLVDLWCAYYYPEQTVLAIFDSYNAFESIPYFNVLKRDNFKVYAVGLLSEFAFIEFESPEKAFDFVASFEYKHKIRWTIYKNGEVHNKSN